LIAQFRSGPLAQIHAALAYYDSNREEIEAYLGDEDAEDVQLQKSSGDTSD